MSPRTNWNIRLLLIHSCWTWKFGWSHSPGTIHRKCCSSQYCSQTLLLIIETSLKVLTLFIILLPYKLILFNIRTSINFFLFSKFFSMKVRFWRPMSDAKYKMQRNHAVEKWYVPFRFENVGEIYTNCHMNKSKKYSRWI